MPTIYNYMTPISVDADRYAALLKREGWFASPTPKPVDKAVARASNLGSLLRPVAWRSNHVGGNTYLAASGKEHASYRTQHRMIQGINAGGIRLLFSNHAGSIMAPNSITVKADIQFLNKSYPVYFRGSRTVVIPPGGHVVSDVSGITLSEADLNYFYTLTYVDAGTGGRIPVGLTGTSTNGEGSNIADATAGGADLCVAAYGDASVNPTFTTDALYGPSAVLGIPSKVNTPAVLVVGDSIVVGAGDGTTGWAAGSTGDFGFILRALQDSSGPRIPYLYSAKYGETAFSAAATPSRFFRGYAFDYCTHVVEEYGTNDVNGAVSAQNIKLSRVQLWRLGADRGKTVYATTIMPRTTSSDSWATVSGQTVTANEANRVDVNNWLRAGAPVNTSLVPVAIGTANALVSGQQGHPLTGGVFEVADMVESGRNSGFWKAAYTADGIHPNTAGHIAAATAINPAVFAIA